MTLTSSGLEAWYFSDECGCVVVLSKSTVSSSSSPTVVDNDGRCSDTGVTL